MALMSDLIGISRYSVFSLTITSAFFLFLFLFPSFLLLTLFLLLQKIHADSPCMLKKCLALMGVSVLVMAF